ncbi:hypothetical protein B0A55_03734 [Friedmanniomyces simplex]|uniref:Heterokaryon incompatibility domain-containing protein n=1 Tax=Friedmanniomyces simplex TaxID=329884 RepID=A0A4U0XLU0_9PEZI|nr:hypothetical protein B0A55_03734 [Friedmanniomyces simplex]
MTVTTYDVSSFTPHLNVSLQTATLASIGRNVVNWPPPEDRRFVTRAVMLALEVGNETWKSADIAWIALQQGWILSADAASAQWDQEGLSRVIAAMKRDASASAHGFVTLIDGNDLGQHETYSAVSHVWGKARRLKLLADNIDELRRGIQVSDLPVSYKEALLVAEQLGLRYLWVDSLCIMQDSPSDWLREAGMMKDVYRNSHLTIGLAGATEHSEASFSQRSGSRIRLPSIETSWAGETVADMYIVKQDFREDYVGSTLSSRAWIHQELYLSPRILLLGREQLWYWCTEGMASETFPGWEPTAIAGLNQGTGAMKHPARDAPPVIQHQEWERNVEKYSRCALTYEGDRMIAISGIASNFQARLHDDYVAGLWRSQLPAQLMWQTTGLGPTRKPGAYRAPSWSWASIEGPVVFKNRPYGVQALRTLCVVEEVAITLKDSANPTGLVLNGSLTLRGTLHPVLPLVESEGNQCLAHYDAAAGQMVVPERSKAVCDCFSIGRRGDSWRSDVCDGSDGFVSERLGRDLAGPEAMTRERADMMGAYCLPLLACDDHGFPFRSGLLLQRSEEKPGTYRRVGVFRAIGIEEAGMFPADQQSLIRII